MTIDLPPRRELPTDVKDRMRPDFTRVRRRNHTPLAAAAGVALLIAGGVTVTRSITDDTPAPGRERVLIPSSHDLDRCRAALNDRSWLSTRMVVFGSRKVLVGEDNRFCELSRTRAHVVAPEAAGARLEAGSITYRSEQVIAGVPPLGARTARARQSNGTYSRGSTDAVVTPAFFVIHAAAPLNVTELVFDDRTVPVPVDAEPPLATSTGSFESGDGDPWTPVNVLARCADNAVADVMRPDDLDGWQPLVTTGLDRQEGLLLAHRAGKEWATCVAADPGGVPGPLHRLHDVPADPTMATVLGSYTSDNAIVFVARTHRAATTVEVSAGSSTLTADVIDGFFAARLPSTGHDTTIPAYVTAVARNADKEIVYAGGFG